MPTASHLGLPLLGASQPQALDLSNARRRFIRTRQRSTIPRLLLRATHPSFCLESSRASILYAHGDLQEAFERLAAFEFLGDYLPFSNLSTRFASCSIVPNTPFANCFRVIFALRTIPIVFRTDLGSSDLDFVSRMSRQNPRRQTELVKDNFASLTQ